MLAFALLLTLAQPPCSPEARRLLVVAAERAEQPDLTPAIEALRAAAAMGCEDGEIGALYLRGLVDAHEAFRQGAPPSALAPVRAAIEALERLAQNQAGPAEIARLMLMAAAAAAQSERDEMRLYLEHAESMDYLLRMAGAPAAPVLAVGEVAGELWLEVHRDDEARVAFNNAARQVGQTPRVVAGLMRVNAAR